MEVIKNEDSGKSKINNKVLIKGEVTFATNFTNIQISHKVIHIGTNKITPVIKRFLKENFLRFILDILI